MQHDKVLLRIPAELLLRQSDFNVLGSFELKIVQAAYMCDKIVSAYP